jgi:adenine-specific DNA-methyltransferase
MNKLKMHSPDLTQANIDKLAELFPNCVTEARDEQGVVKRSIDFDQLRQELSNAIVEGPQERYQLNWPGKREALLTANAPIAKTLRPCREESVDFETTKNLFIEGDNLDALKLLQETYLNKVKMIYIDPPYNTGNDFIYEDDFAEDSDTYKQRSNQKDKSGNRLIANTEANGRFHSDWLSMMYSRLRLARNLLHDDGVIFISIDDGEIANLRKACDEVFGEEKFIAELIWKSRQNKDNRTKNGASIDHEYVLTYGKSIRGADRDLTGYSNPDKDPRGNWTSANMVGLATADRRPNLHYDLINPKTKIDYGCPQMGWRYDRTTMARLIEEGRILWPATSDGRPRRKAFVDELTSEQTGFSSIIGKDLYTRNGTADIEALFGQRVMDFPKPVGLLEELIRQAGVDKDGIVLDFFSGSATTAHAVMSLNAGDGGLRRFVMVQLPEMCDEKSAATSAGYKTITEIGKERIRRAGKKVKQENAGKSGIDKLDIGFRVLKIDSSNMKEVFYTPDAVSQDLLSEQVNNIREDRTSEDLLFQVLLDWGVDLALPITQESIAGKAVYFVDGNALAACFEEGVNEDFVKLLAKRAPLRAVFRDAGFASDSVKINVEQIFKLMSPSTEVKTI